MTRKAILFDFGGTIDTDGVHWSEKFWEVYEDFAVPVSKEQFEKAYVAAEERLNTGIIKKEDTFEKVLYHKLYFQLDYLANNTDAISKEERGPLTEKLSSSCYKNIKDIINKSRHTLDILSGSYRLAVVSNFYGNIVSVLKDFSLDRYFETVVDSGIEGVRKPDPELWAIGIRRLNMEPGNCIVTGDSYKNDIAPAKKLGCSTIWIDRKSWTRPDETSAADFTVNSLADIKKILL